MWTQWRAQPGFARTYDLLSNFRRQMDQTLGELGGYGDGMARDGALASWPELDLDDRGAELVLTATVPGMTEKDLDITATADAMTVSGAREVKAPESYSVHRQERPSYRFSRSVRFPTRIDVEKIKAVVTNGVLTVTMAKSADAQPRQIAVKKA